jgi:hypothetical protein
MDDTYRKILPMFPGPEYRQVFMAEIFDLTYHGGGGFGYFDVWNMSVSQRRCNIKKINEHLKKIQDLRDQQTQTVTEKTDMSKFNIPEHVKQTSKDFEFVTKAKSKK